VHGGTGANTLIGDDPAHPADTASDSFFVAGEDTVLDKQFQDWKFSEF